MRGIILFVLSFWTAISMAQGNPPPAGAFIYSAGSWIAASSTYTGSPINAPPPVALYCLNSSNQWVPANSSCTLGGGNITWPATGDIVVSNSSNSPAGLAPVNGECVIGSGGAWVAGSCSGSGTSVTSVTGDSNIITNSASTGAVTLTIAGTSGGIPYFASTSSWRTSALLATNALVVGGGAGAAPATGNGDFTYATHTLTGGASALLTLAATNALTLSAMSGTACLEEVSGVVTSTGAACGTTSLAFSGITSGTNSAAAMLVGTGASLGVSGTGTINATSVNSNTFPASAGLTSGGLIYGSSASVYASDADFTISSHTLSGGASALISLAAANALTLSAMTGTSCLEEVSGVVTATGSACGSGGGTAESSITAPTTTNTITETAAGDWIARNGVETASLTAPWSFSNANSTNNNTSSALIVGVTGSSTGGVALVLNDVSGTGDEFRIYHGSTVSSNALTGGSLEFNIDNSGDFTAAGIGIVKGAGAASTAGFALTGAPFTGGSGTTTYPFFYLNDGTAPTTWSTAGTEFGVNSPSGFTGNMLDFHVNGGASVAKLDYQGNLTVAACSGCGSVSLVFPLTVSGTTTSGGIPYFSSTTVLTSSALLATNHVLLGGGAGSAPTSDSNLDDGVTTANTLTYAGAGGVKASAGPLTASAPAGDAGMLVLVGNTANQTCPTNDFCIAGFNSASATAYGWQPSTTAPSGTQFMMAGTPSSGYSSVTYESTVTIAQGGTNATSSSAGTILNATSGSAASWTATPTLGASGTLGSLTFGNATSGLLTLETATGAITSYTLQLPVAQPSGSNTYLSCTAASPAVCTWVAGGGGTPAYPLTITGGVSGGVVYGSSSTQLTVSTAGTANVLMKWGGAGAAPGSSSITDNATVIAATEGMTLTPTSTSQIGLIVNNPTSTSVDIADFEVNGTKEAAIGNVGSLTLGAANCTTFGTAGGMCAAEGTSATNVSGTSNLYPDSTSHEWKAATNGSTSYGTMVRAQPGAIRSTGLTGSVSTATLCAASAGACNVAGTYHVHLAMYQSGTACTSNATGGVSFQLTWTDANGTAHSAQTIPIIGNSLGTTATGFITNGLMLWGATALGPYASGDINIDTNGTVVQYATTFSQCSTTGTATYALSAAVTRVQ
jgi:hypothetical protein